MTGCVDRAGAAPRPLKARRTSPLTVPIPGAAFGRQRRHGSATAHRRLLDDFDVRTFHCRGSELTDGTVGRLGGSLFAE